MATKAVRPYLITRDDEGIVRITVRTTRFNSQNYPIVTATTLEQVFPSISSARAFARTEFRAEATDIATK